MDQEVTYERPRRRGSAFTEIGLEGHDEILDKKLDTLARPKLQVRFRSNISVVEPEAVTSEPPTPLDVQDLVKPTSRVAPWLQIVVLVMALLLVAPSINVHPLLSSISFVPPMAQASPVRPRSEGLDTIAAPPIKRTDSQTDVCKRWSGQSAVVNGTLYYYGGRSTSSAEQTSDTWNNNFVSIDLSQDWQISSPIIKGLPIPSGPPAVSLGSLWASTDNLYLYGGEFSDNPVDDPTAFALWSYDISSGNWNEHDNPTFANGDAVQRAAEGAGISVPGLGRGYYFGGHLDYLTTQGWSQQVARVYLPTLLEFTMPGFSNAALDSKSPTGSDGAYRNISTENAGFPERADGILVYVPGYSNEGIILGLAGGTNATFTQMNVIDVYDIASSTWYKQATSGSTPEIRVNPCAVAATAADGSSTQVYMYGGQNLIPAGEQTQYDDVWILTLPSFTWIKVNTDGQSVPPARAGHTCNIWNGQMVVVGGYVGQDLSCDSPGIYVFNTSSLSWQNNYVALSGADPLNRQESQKDDTNALQGSYGYEVPSAVQSIVGGNAVGGATITGPAQTATSGPLATGKPHTYTVTNPDGSTATATSVPGSGTDATSKNGGGGGGGSSTNVGAIVAGVIAGLLFLLVIYLVYCAYVYRKQLKVYKNHTAMAQRSRLAGSTSDPPFMVFRQNGKASTKGEQSGSSHGEKSNGDRFSSDNRSGNSNNASANSARRQEWPSNNPYNNVPGGQGYATAASSTEDLMSGMEPTFLGVLLNPRRSLRVVNRD